MMFVFVFEHKYTYITIIKSVLNERTNAHSYHWANKTLIVLLMNIWNNYLVNQKAPLSLYANDSNIIKKANILID